ncbi:AraC family transcriptional regulator [Gracilibacillus oryzae]|nr:AraC family transcriptional regulator [Gracilibacillus oryzae]
MLNELFPYSFSYKNSKEPQNELPDHAHDYHEIIYVHCGKGKFFIDNRLYEMNKGDIFIVPHDTLHHAKPNNDDLITSTVIFFSAALIHNLSIDEPFSYLSLIDNMKKETDYKIQLEQSDQLFLEGLFARIDQELAEEKLGSAHASVLITHQILLELSRVRAKQNKGVGDPSKGNQDWMQQILTYIDNNLHREVTLPMLAKQALLSTAHFSRVFKQTTGMGPTAYLNKKRIFKAKEMLLHSDHTIAFIAEEIGYESIPHFYRMFRKYIGITPARFRRANKGRA